MSCHKCKHAINWERPLVDEDSIRAMCGFTCNNFDISGKYKNAYDTITCSNVINLMLYEFPSNECWVDGGSTIPKEGCINFKNMYDRTID